MGGYGLFPSSAVSRLGFFLFSPFLTLNLSCQFQPRLIKYVKYLVLTVNKEENRREKRNC